MCVHVCLMGNTGRAHASCGCGWVGGTGVGLVCEELREDSLFVWVGGWAGEWADGTGVPFAVCAPTSVMASAELKGWPRLAAFSFANRIN